MAIGKEPGIATERNNYGTIIGGMQITEGIIHVGFRQSNTVIELALVLPLESPVAIQLLQKDRRIAGPGDDNATVRSSDDFWSRCLRVAAGELHTGAPPQGLSVGSDFGGGDLPVSAFARVQKRQ